MKKFELLLYSLLFSFTIAASTLAQAPTSAWINEFHYDNDGGDVNEFVEIIVNEGFSDLANFTVTFYNGNGGAEYDSETLDNFSQGSTQDGFTIYSKLISGIQNGSPDGLAIDYSGTLIAGQFLSYEGTFTAVGGPADGLMSTDIGVVQNNTTTPLGSSIGLTGTGTQYSDFTWTNFDGSATIGTTNGSQTLPVELSSFSASIINEGIKLNWRTETEVNNYGFEIHRQLHTSTPLSVTEWDVLSFVEGHGNSNSPKDYTFLDDYARYGKYAYRLKQIDTDGSFEYSDVIEVEAGNIPDGFVLEQNYPNPFNPTTSIKFALAESQNAVLKVFDVLGNEVATPFNGIADGGKVYEAVFNAANLSSGVYFYRLETQNRVINKKMLLLK